MTLRKLSRASALFTTILVFAAAALAADAPACPATAPNDEAQVVQALQTMYVAATSDDLAVFHSVAAADFYAYDGGKRFDGDAIMTMVKKLHAGGTFTSGK